MKKNLYTPLGSFVLLVLFHLLPSFVQAQTCSTLVATTTVSESRCMATGVISVQASGGSGNYNYKVIGPVATSFTSSKIITGLQAGTYQVIVRDINKNCQIELDNIVVNGAYSDPRFLLSGTDVTCAGNDGSIAVTGQQYGRAPFTYTIVAPSPTGIGTTNNTGAFSNLVAGEYAIQLKDSCGGIQVRRITLQNYSWWFDGVTVTKTDCNNADAVIHLKDNKGNTNSASAAFAGFVYGVVNAPGDTMWTASNSFSFYTGIKRSAHFVAKDPCSNLHTYTWQVPTNEKPAVSSIGFSNQNCTSFTAKVNGKKNLTQPVLQLYNAANTQVATNSTGVFDNVPYGKYCINIVDACYDTTIKKCFTVSQPTPSVSNTVAITNRTCTTFDATITGQTALYNPEYCLYDATNLLLSCNTTGLFTNINYGSYCIKVEDGCTGTVLDRCFTIAKPIPILTTVAISGQNCTTFNASANGTDFVNPQFCLYDAFGNVIACNNTGIFTGIANGNYCMRAISCGDTTAPVCFSGIAPRPAVDADVFISSKDCNTFSAAVTGQTYFTSPEFCLIDANGVQLYCNTTGVFDAISYGSYCIKITDGCYDTTINRCFTQVREAPYVDATMQQLNAACSTFTAQVTGQKNLYSPQYCIYDAANNLVQCNTTGVFNNLPYGTYCMEATDACTNTVVRICQTFSYKYAVSIITSKSCTIGSAIVDISFEEGNNPFALSVLHPDNSIVYAGTAATSTAVVLPALAAGEVYTIIGTDNCGVKDTATVVPDASTVTKAITAVGKCPSSAWLNGSGDLNITAVSNLSTVTPKIIKKNGITFSKAHSSNSGTEYVFSDLEPATYIVEYSIQSCNTKLYDTFALQPYEYPTQGRSAIFQCDNKSINLSAEVAGGVGPYQYQIIGNEPDFPSIVTAEQSSPLFNINNGITYSLIRLRTVDACGNATLNDVSVLPLQNILITADTTCLFNNINLSVDTIQDAIYSWYKKLDETDSVFLTNDKTYSIPFMQQQDIGTYVCKVELNNSCLTRLASFELTGDCGEVYLAVPFSLTGKTETAGNTLVWTPTEPKHILYYDVERKQQEHGSFTSIGRIYATAGTTLSRLQFIDTSLGAGPMLYRVKVVLQDGKVDYTNSISLQRRSNATVVYPNPVQRHAMIEVTGTNKSNYRIELRTITGQLVYKKELQSGASLQHRYNRPHSLPRGMYVLQVTNLTTGTASHHKLLFE